MGFVRQPWQLLLVILLSDDQRRRLAVKAKVLGRRVLAEIGTLFTPDTILRRHRRLVAQKWDYSDQRQKGHGRPPLSEEVTRLVVQMARRNPRWGYDRIQGRWPTWGTISRIKRSATP